MVYELSGESRLRSMVRESSMELKPAALSKGGGLYRLRLAPLLVWGRVLQPKARLFLQEALSQLS